MNINGETKKVIRVIHYIDGTVEIRTVGNKEIFIFNRVEDGTKNIKL